MPTFKLIAAIGQNGELGKNNELLWNLPNDLHNFKQLTSGHPVVMGSKTFESLKLPNGLPNRKNIVLTRKYPCNTIDEKTGIITARSRDDVLQMVNSHEVVWIIGGAEIYRIFEELVDEFHLTIVSSSYPEADTYYSPRLDTLSELVHNPNLDIDVSYGDTKAIYGVWERIRKK